LLAELSLRYAFHAAPQLEMDVYQRGEDGVLRLRPNIVRRHVTQQWDVRLAIDAQGRRDAAPEAAADGPTIVGLGDSIAFGWGVELEDSFLTLLERRLGGRVIKAGVPGTGTCDQLRLFKSTDFGIEPDLVLAAFFVGNDFIDVVSGGTDRFAIEGGLARLKDGGETSGWPGLRTRLARSSHLLQLLRAMQLRWLPRPDAPSERQWDVWMRRFASVHLRQPPEETLRAFELTTACLDDLESASRERGAKLAVLAIPRSWQIDAAERDEMMRVLSLRPGEIDLDRPQRELAAWAERTDTPYLDLLDAFRARQAPQSARRLYYSPDAHLTPAGHAAAAEAAEEWLRQAASGELP